MKRIHRLLRESIRTVLREIDEGDRESYIVPTESLCKKLYARYNDYYFGGQLPQNLPIKINNRISDKTYGYAKPFLNGTKLIPNHIGINGKYRYNLFTLKSVLLHEMIHVYDFITSNPQRVLLWKSDKIANKGHDDYFYNNPVSKRIIADGYPIEQYVTDEEIETSSIRDDLQKARDKRKSKAIAKGIFAEVLYHTDTKCVEFYQIPFEYMDSYVSRFDTYKNNYPNCDMYIIYTNHEKIVLGKKYKRKFTVISSSLEEVLNDSDVLCSTYQAYSGGLEKYKQMKQEAESKKEELLQKKVEARSKEGVYMVILERNEEFKYKTFEKKDLLRELRNFEDDYFVLQDIFRDVNDEDDEDYTGDDYVRIVHTNHPEMLKLRKSNRYTKLNLSYGSLTKILNDQNYTDLYISDCMEAERYLRKIEDGEE